MEQKTEQKNSNTCLKAILRSPAIHTPAVPIADWTSELAAVSVVLCTLSNFAICTNFIGIQESISIDYTYTKYSFR